MEYWSITHGAESKAKLFWTIDIWDLVLRLLKETGCRGEKRDE